MSLSFFISVFFSKAKSAVLLGIMFYFIGYFLSFAVDDEAESTFKKLVGSLVPLVAFTLGINNLLLLEQGQVGVQHANVTETYENYSFSAALLMMAFDAVLFIGLAWYFNSIWPREWGTTRPWYFLCQKSYWRPREAVTRTDFSKEVKWGDAVEPVDPNLEELKGQGRAMVVRDLAKSYDGTLVVDQMNLDIYEGQIFGLLGHNGAGKTTTISMLCGMIPVSGGDMQVNGLYLSKDLAEIRHSLGFCPQSNTLYNELTAREHLRLFSVFKGTNDLALIAEQSDKIIEDLDMVEFQDRQVKYLSGGQKRRISLALALIGNPSILILDEPTAGMDLTARRLVWDLLKNSKSGRIIILTTHYMEEADVLSDRIAIMTHGTLRCLGSSLFLKARYGVGYYLKIVSEPGTSGSQLTEGLVEFLGCHVEGAKLISSIHNEVKFMVPMDQEQNFKSLFSALDNGESGLPIKSYAISVTTLEEVFLRVARGDDSELKAQDNEEFPGLAPSEFHLERDRDRSYTGLKHFAAILRKRYLTSKRDLKSVVFEIIVPCALVLAGLILLLIADRFVDYDPYKLTISKYESTQSVWLGRFDGSDLSGVKGQFSEGNIEIVSHPTLKEFDQELFNARDTDPFRMGAIFFNKFNPSAHEYEPIIFHNQTALQSLPTYYAAVSEAVLKTVDPGLTVTGYNYPLPWTKEVAALEGISEGFLAALIFAMGFSFVPAGIVAFIVLERETNVKHQHMISGISLFSYWFGNFFWDIGKHLIPAVISALLVLAFSVDIFVDEGSSYAALWSLLILFGFSVTAFTYFSSFFFKSYSSAQVLTLIFHLLTGGLLPIAVFIMRIFDSTRSIAKALSWVFRLAPTFCFGMGVVNISGVDILAKLDGESEDYNALSLDSAGADILMLGLTTVLYLLLTIVAESFESTPTLRKMFHRKRQVIPEQNELDEDVGREKEIALRTDPATVQLSIKGITKIFGQKEAVKDISFNVNKGECFALLGVNGAGKTTTFKILTGEEIPTSGEAFVGGYNAVKELSKVRELIGYCPQFDALSEYLTCKEHLELYADIKRIPKTRKAELVGSMLQQMDLIDYTNSQSRTLSGGNKRKLSTAMALIGNPTVIFLDEPSAGMDPKARKNMWLIIGNIKKLGSSVVLTTHSMEEAEALSDRMTIMVAGQLRCFGTATDIKTNYGEGYELEVKTQIPNKVEVAEKVAELGQFPGQFITEGDLDTALTVLGVPQFVDDITEKGDGAAVYLQLKNEKGVSKEFLVSWVITESLGERIYEHLCGNYDQVDLIEHYLSLFRFKIGKQQGKTIGFLFSDIGSSKEGLRISDYALSQTSLEQIFNSFASEAATRQRSIRRRMAGENK